MACIYCLYGSFRVLLRHKCYQPDYIKLTEYSLKSACTDRNESFDVKKKKIIISYKPSFVFHCNEPFSRSEGVHLGKTKTLFPH